MNLSIFINKIYVVFIFLICITLLTPLQIFASGTPSHLSYQGKLTDTGGNPLGGGGTLYYFKFSLWDSSTPGTGNQVWPLTPPNPVSLTVKQGSFNVLIGDTDNGYPDTLDYDFNSNNPVYLQIEVSSDGDTYETLAPRSTLSSTAFSKVSESVHGTSDSSFGTATGFANTLVSMLSTAIDKAVLTIKGAAGQVANLFNILDSNDNSLFTVTASGNVGVGTSTPSAKLDVWGNLRVATGTTPALFVNTASGNVGVGTSTPGYAITMGGSGRIALSNGTQANPALTFAEAPGLGIWKVDNSNMSIGRSNGAQLTIGPSIYTSSNIGAGFGTASSAAFSNMNSPGTGMYFPLVGSLALTTAGTERFRLDSSGNVGIGTTTPSSKLVVSGDMLAVGTTTLLSNNAASPALIAQGSSGQTGNILEVRNSSGGIGFYFGSTGAPYSTGGTYVASGYSQAYTQYSTADANAKVAFTALKDGQFHIQSRSAPIYFETDTSYTVPKMMLSTSGSLGINTTSPTSMLQINASSSTAIGQIIKGAASQTADLFQVQDSAGSSLVTIGSGGNIATAGSVSAGNNGFIFNGSAGFGSITRNGATGTMLLTSQNFTGANIGVVLSNAASSFYVQAAASQSSNIQEWRNSSGTALNVVNPTGSLGINTSNPLNKLDVNGSVALGVGTGAANGQVTIRPDSGSQFWFGAGALNGTTTTYLESAWVDATGNPLYSRDIAITGRYGGNVNNLSLYANNSFFNGNVGIGTTTALGKLHVYHQAGSEFYTKDNLDGIILVNNVASKSIGLSTSQLGTYGGNGSVGLKLVEGAGVAGAGTISLLNDGGVGFTYKGGSVGIGTTTPTSKLTLGSGQIEVPVGSATAPSYSFTNDLNTGIYNSAADALGFTAGGVNRLGVNTTYIGSSVKFLNVDGSSSAPAYSFGSEQGLGVYRAGSGILGFTSGGSERMRIDSSGNIGIGTTTINARLQVNTAASTKGLIIQAAASQLSNLFEVQDSAGTAKLFVDASGYLNAGTSDFRLYANGGQPIFRGLDGWTGVWSDSAATTFFQTGRTNGNTTFSAFTGSSIGRLSFQVDNTGSNGIVFGTGNTALPNGYFEIRQGAVTNLVVARSTGNVGIGTTTPTQKLSVIGNAQFTSVTSGTYAFDLNLTSDGTLTTSASDERLKTNITTLNSSSTLDKILQLQPSEFDWKSNNTHDVGLIAQEVEKIFPELVFTNPTDGYKGVNYSRFITLLIASVQEIATKVSSFAKEFKSEKITTTEFCIDDICITKEEFRTMIQNSNTSYHTQNSLPSASPEPDSIDSQTGTTTDSIPPQDNQTSQDIGDNGNIQTESVVPIEETTSTSPEPSEPTPNETPVEENAPVL